MLYASTEPVGLELTNESRVCGLSACVRYIVQHIYDQHALMRFAQHTHTLVPLQLQCCTDGWLASVIRTGRTVPGNGDDGRYKCAERAESSISGAAYACACFARALLMRSSGALICALNMILSQTCVFVCNEPVSAVICCICCSHIL